MSFAQGSRTRLSFITESTFGTTPAGNFANLPYNTHSLNLSKERVIGNQIREDRMTRDDRHGNRTAGGDVVVDMRADDYDALLESAMFSTWDASPVGLPDELKVGTTPKYFSIEDYAADIDYARVFTGMAVSTLGVNIAPNQMVQATFGFVGKGMSIGQTEKTVDASSSNAPFDAYSGDIQIGNVAAASTSAIITSIDFTLNNSLSPTFVVGADETPQLEYGMAQVEGNMSVYFEDDAIINRFLNETETEIIVQVDDPTAGNQYEFHFPKAKINGADVSVDNPQSRIIQIPFVALYDSTEGSNLVIRRPDTT